jgi:hypothetical protein
MVTQWVARLQPKSVNPMLQGGFEYGGGTLKCDTRTDAIADRRVEELCDAPALLKAP